MFNAMNTLGHLYCKIIYNNETCVGFLKEKSLLPDEQKFCDKVHGTEVCGGELEEYLKNSRKRDSDREFIKSKYIFALHEKGLPNLPHAEERKKFFHIY